MAPPRKIVQEQLEILISFLENNKGYANGLSGALGNHAPMKQKWASLAKRMNSVQGGNKKTADDWRKFWFEWRYGVRRRASMRQLSNSKRFLPLDDLEIRVLKLSEATMGPLKIGSIPVQTKKTESIVNADEDSDRDDSKECIVKADVDSDGNNITEPFEAVHLQPAEDTIPVKNMKSMKVEDNNSESSTSPLPKWAIDIEERRIAAEERMARALECIAGTMTRQEERWARVERRITDALTSLSASMHDLNSTVVEAVKLMQPNNTETTKETSLPYYNIVH